MSHTGAATAAQPTEEDPDVARVLRINVILEALGVSPSRAATQLHSHPEAMHRIAPQDLLYLAQHADLLAGHQDVRCDVVALSMILWALHGQVDANLDDAMLSITAATVAGSADRPPSMAELHRALHDRLIQANRVTRILRAFEEPVALGVSQEKLRITGEDVQVATRMTEKLAALMHELTRTDDGATVSVVKRYDVRGHELLKACERNISSLWVLLGTLVGRSDVDVVPVLKVFNEKRQWQTSGSGVLSTESYGQAVALVSQSLFTRRADFENGDEVAATLVFQRLASRPPFRWEVFRLLHFTPQLHRAMEGARLPFQQSFGLLSTFAKLQQTLESYLTVEGATRDVAAQGTAKDEKSHQDLLHKRLTGVKATRRALVRHLARFTAENSAAAAAAAEGSAPSPAALSFGQLLVLAMVSGMPEADLTDSDALVDRAVKTNLVDKARGTHSELLKPELLRVLLAYAYTVPTGDGRIEHAPLQPKSIMALYRSISLYFFQEEQFQAVLQTSGKAAATPLVNPQCTHALLRSHLLVQLLVRNALSDAGSGEDDGDGITQMQLPQGAEEEGGRQKAAEKTTNGATAMMLLDAMHATVNTIYEATDRLQESALALQGEAGVPAVASSVFSAVPEQVSAVTALTTTLLFFLWDSAPFLQHVPLRKALDVAAQVFALRAATPPGRSATTEQRKVRQEVLNRMQRRLAYIPQHMNAADVCATLLERVVPMAQPRQVAHPNRLRLALLEAFLRSLATSVAAFAIPDELMLAHWVDALLPCLTNKSSAALAVAAHDFFTAPFLAPKPITPLFTPTYVAVLVPTAGTAGRDGHGTAAEGDVYANATGKYGEPPMALVKRFASTVRAVCQGLERCDGTALAQMLQEEQSPVSRFLSRADLASPASASAAANEAGERYPYVYSRADALAKLTPTNAALLIVSALFDKLCMLWNSAPGYVRDAQQRFTTYFSGLVNLLQCANTQVLQRVCASIEALMVEHMRGAGAVQMEFLKYVSVVVDNVRGNSKKGVAEWFLRLSEKMHKETRRAPSKL